jgi:hypothetical protein
MTNQWQSLLENVGEWQGSFTTFSPQGREVNNIQTTTILQAINSDQTMRQTVRRFPENQPIEEKVLEYSTLSRGILFFTSGAFSFGSMQLAPHADLGAEAGLIDGDRRLRLVQLFNRNSELEKITVIREKLPTSKTDYPQNERLTIEQLIGTWEGEAETIFADWSEPKKNPTQLQISYSGDKQITQELRFGSSTNPQSIKSHGEIDGHLIKFTQGSQNTQVVLLPDGASSNCPQQLKFAVPTFWEVGWLINPNKRQRLIRSYNGKGEWQSLTLVTEHKA